MRKVKFAIIGAGTSGLTAMSQIRQQTDDFVLINGGKMGTTCARVGCMPSKALIWSAEHFHARQHFADLGIDGAEALTINDAVVLKRVRQLRDRFSGGVAKNVLESLSSEQFIEGYATFLDAHRLQVGDEVIEAERIIIATGSRPVVPAPWQALGDRLLTSDEIFELENLPKRVAVIGLGAIGIELGQAMARLGVEVLGFEKLNTVAGLSAPQSIKQAIELYSQEMKIFLGDAVDLEASEQGVMVKHPKEGVFEVDAVLCALGRRPNIDTLNIEATGVPLDAMKMPVFDPETLQVGNAPIFIAGDVNRFRPILHEAGYEGEIAGRNAIDYPNVHAYHRVTPMGVVFTDPQVAMFGQRYSELDDENTAVVSFDLTANNGRAIVMQADRGGLSLYADKSTKRLLGGELVMKDAEHLVHLLAWAVEQQMTIPQLLTMPFYHPVLEEAIQSALKQLAKQIMPNQPLSTIKQNLNP